MTNFVGKTNKKKYLKGQFHQFKNLMWLYYKIETLGGQFANNPNPRGCVDTNFVQINHTVTK